ncbi:MAG: isochorismatase family protein [Candidatus Krumholzibacteriia bacterium]
MSDIRTPAGSVRPGGPFAEGDALLVCDLQCDFCPGGSLEVPGAEEIIPILNRWIEVASRFGVPIVASRDWHPHDHGSFTAEGGPWPPHAVRDTQGARFHPQLALPANVMVIDKGTDRSRDSVSAFSGTGLRGRLRDHGVRRLWIGGLALDACVHSTVLDALDNGFQVNVLTSATRARDHRQTKRRLDEMRSLGAKLVEGGP